MVTKLPGFSKRGRILRFELSMITLTISGISQKQCHTWKALDE